MAEQKIHRFHLGKAPATDKRKYSKKKRGWKPEKVSARFSMGLSGCQEEGGPNGQ